VRDWRSTPIYCQLQSHVTQKLGQNNKSGSDNVRFRGHLPAPIVNGEEIAFENDRISDFEGLVTLTLTLGHTEYRHASLIDLYLHTKSH